MSSYPPGWITSLKRPCSLQTHIIRFSHLANRIFLFQKLMDSNRLDLVRYSFEKKALPVDVPEERISEYYGELVFDRPKMRRYLKPDVLKALLDCIDNSKPLDRNTADGVARGMKDCTRAGMAPK